MALPIICELCILCNLYGPTQGLRHGEQPGDQTLFHLCNINSYIFSSSSGFISSFVFGVRLFFIFLASVGARDRAWKRGSRAKIMSLQPSGMVWCEFWWVAAVDNLYKSLWVCVCVEVCVCVVIGDTVVWKDKERKKKKEKQKTHKLNMNMWGQPSWC